MRSFSQTIRDQVWARLRQIYMNFTKGDNNITLPQVQQFIVQVLGERNRDEIQYVTNNLSRLDQDGNGDIEFEQFANFLLKQHCGEMALQKMHRNGAILNHSQRKITFQEFNTLLNNAYQFLGIQTDTKQTALLFAQADQDHDNLMTYTEYFQFVQKFICRPKIKVPQRIKVTQQRVQFNSRFRRFLWQQLARIFALYDFNRNRLLSYSQCERMFRDLFPSLSQTEIELLLRGIFLNGTKQISFDQFMKLFIVNIFNRNIIWHFGGKTHFTKDQFIQLIRLTLNFIDIGRVQDILLFRLFDRIDTNKDGLISLDQYNRWFTNFLAVLSYYDSQYITQDDDLSLAIGNQYILAYLPKPAIITPIIQSTVAPVLSVNTSATLNTQQVVVRRQIRTSGGINFNPFNFSSQQLALRVRNHLMRLLISFDTNNNKNFEQQEIIHILITLMKEDRNQIMYVIANVFRYDRNGDRRVTYEQLCDFFLESHCGQLAIQRLHRKDAYQRGSEKLMNLEEFIYTLNYALSFIEIQASPQQLAVLFREIDKDRDGWITYREYFEFLKYYFGSKSYAAMETTIQRIQTLPMTQFIPQPIYNQFQIILMDQNLALEQRLRRMLRLHLNKTLDAYDFDGNRMLTSNEIISLLQTLFGYNAQQIGFVMDILKRNQVMKRQQFVDLLLGIHFNQFGFVNNLRLDRFNQSDFSRIVDILSSFLSVRLSPDQYIILFRTLDVGRGGYITITQWEDFITRLFGKHVYRTRIVQNTGFFGEIWGQFRNFFSLYDVGNKGYLSDAELQLFLRQILLECQHKTRNTIIKDLQRLGPINFDRFASFILARCAQNALSRFHLQQPAGNDRLSQRQFILIVQSAYEFLKSISRNTDSLKKSYAQINKHHDGLDYKTFIDWAYSDIARNVR